MIPHSWDDAIAAVSPSSNCATSILTEQEDKLLSRGQDSVSEVINIIRQTARAVVSLTDFSDHRDSSVLRLDPEPSLSTLTLQADLLVNESTIPPVVGDVGVGTWSLLVRNGGNISVFLDACEPLLIPLADDYLSIDSSRDVASNLLRQQLTALGLHEDITNYAKLIDDINKKTEISSLDKLRLIHYIGSLLWTSDGGINASVALQLFKFLTYPTSIQGEKASTLCQEVFIACASDTETYNVSKALIIYSIQHVHL